MNNDRCFCGHLARFHSPFKEITIRSGSAWKQVELTSCKWCDKTLLNLEVRKALNRSKYTIRETKTEGKALPPHPLAESEPLWMIAEGIQEVFELLDELSLKKTLLNLYKLFEEKDKD